MTDSSDAANRASISEIYRTESRRVHATLIRLLGDFDLAEEALHDAFLAAIEQWSRDGIPHNPRAWLVSTGRFKGIDQLRRRAHFDAKLERQVMELGAVVAPPPDVDDESIEDDRLRLIFTCCHPALPIEGQIALTLREVCGLTTEEIAHALLATAPTIAQRIVRAKGKIKDSGIPYQVPARGDLPGRLDAVLQVVYLVFNEGYFASRGETLTRADLCAESIRLGRLVVELLPEPDAEALGLLALMLLHDARRDARSSPSGDLVLLDEQDRSKWNTAQVAEGVALVERALGMRRTGPYGLQAAIAAVHSEARSAAETDWSEIIGLYDVLLRFDPSPVIELNRAAAIAMRDGANAGVELIDALLARGELREYEMAHAARGELLRRLGNTTEALEAYRRALSLTRQETQRRFLERRISELGL